MHIVFLLYPGVTQLDLTGPAQFLARMPDAKLDAVAKSLDPIETDCGFSLLPSATLADIDRADVICVPGGFGCVAAAEDDEIRRWLAEAGAHAQWVTSVCTGSLVLGAAGLLLGYRAACHWAWRDYLTLFGAEAVAERVVFDRNRITGGGVTAGIDFGLALIAAIAGEDQAKAIQLGLEYDPAPPFDAGSPEKAGPALVAQAQAANDRRGPDRATRLTALAAKLAAE